MKHKLLNITADYRIVAPPAGAWIETNLEAFYAQGIDVAPPAGAWIETRYKWYLMINNRVAPPAGAWIETVSAACMLFGIFRRAPRGRVD